MGFAWFRMDRTDMDFAHGYAYGRGWTFALYQDVYDNAYSEHFSQLCTLDSLLAFSFLFSTLWLEYYDLNST